MTLKTWREYNLGPFVLGTVQLGLPYGVANKIGQPGQEQAMEIINAAWNAGVRVFDTAQNYGTSEQVLGKAMQELGISKEALIITKLSSKYFCDQKNVLAAIELSLASLQCTKVFGLLAHSSDVLQQLKSTCRIFEALKASGKVAFTGVSVYNVSEARTALETEHFDLIQMPLNVLDRRPVAADLIMQAKKNNKLLLFRSAFLQGLLVKDPIEELPANLQFAYNILKEWWQLCQNSRVSSKRAAIKIADHLAGGFPLVIGVESASQLKENVDSLEESLPQVAELIDQTELISKSCTEQLLNPSLW